MRFNLKFELKEKEIPIDYRGMFLSYIKSAFEEYNKEWYDKNYKDNNTIIKPFTFAIYMSNPKFEKDCILLDKNEIIFNFSTSSAEYGIYFFNSMLKKTYKPYTFRNITLKLLSINMSREKTITDNIAVFKTLSPIVVRNHNKEQNKDEHLVWDNENFEKQLKINILENIKDFFDFDVSKDVENMKIKIGNMKTIPIAHFNEKIKKRVIGNVGVVEFEGENYILEYLYKAGIGSRRSQGFGMCEIIS